MLFFAEKPTDCDFFKIEGSSQKLYLTAMNNKCLNCRLINFPGAEFCARCKQFLVEEVTTTIYSDFLQSKILKRIVVLILVCIFTVLGFYLSLIVSAAKLTYAERKTIEPAIAVIKHKGFSDEAFLLEHVTAFRSNDNWLNASVEKENAYAATNFPFEIMTLYPEFFTVPLNDTEHAAILLHEAKHLQGADEKEAYEFVWKHRKQLGWTKDFYANSLIWQNVRKQTREYAPHLFVCDANQYGDCTE